MDQETLWGLGSLIIIICMGAYFYLWIGVENKTRVFTPQIKAVMVGLLGSVLFIDVFFSEYTITRLLATIATALVLSWTITKPADSSSASSNSSSTN